MGLLPSLAGVWAAGLGCWGPAPQKGGEWVLGGVQFESLLFNQRVSFHAMKIGVLLMIP